MIDDFAKAYLHSDLRDIRATMLWKLDGLSEYDARRPLTGTGTNLLGMIKHLSVSEAWYFGDVFGRPTSCANNSTAGSVPTPPEWQSTANSRASGKAIETRSSKQRGKLTRGRPRCEQLTKNPGIRDFR
jgi:Protein of unknown function (DUF664)